MNTQFVLEIIIKILAVNFALISMVMFLGLTASKAWSEEGLSLEKTGTKKVYFTHNGKPLLSFGGLSDFIFYAAKDAINFQLWADWAEEHGINHVRAYPPLSWKYIEEFAEDNGGSVENVLFPYEETETGSRQFDLTKFDEAYWKRFRKKCEYFAKKGIIIHLLMWNGWQLRESDKNWGGHFFNPKNNVNSFTEHLGGELDNRFKIYHSVADDNTELVNAQKAWFSKLVEETHELGNVYFDLVHEIAEHCGEWKKTTEWIEEMALTVREQFKEINPDGMVILGMDAGGLEGFPSNDIGMPKPGSRVDWIFSRPFFDVLIWGKVHHVENAREWRKKYKKPYIGQESWDDSGDKYSYRCPNHRVHIRKYFWKFMMAKCQQMDLYVKPRSKGQSSHVLPKNPKGYPHNYDPNGWNRFEDDALILREFWSSLIDYPNLWFRYASHSRFRYAFGTQPGAQGFDGSIKSGPGSHQYVLSSEKEAVAYCSSANGKEGVKFKSQNLKLLHLALKDGTYTAEIFKPDKGVLDRRKVEVKDGDVSIELPEFNDDIAVHIWRH